MSKKRDPEIDSFMSDDQFGAAAETRSNALKDLQCQKSKVDSTFSKLLHLANIANIQIR